MYSFWYTIFVFIVLLDLNFFDILVLPGAAFLGVPSWLRAYRSLYGLYEAGIWRMGDWITILNRICSTSPLYTLCEHLPSGAAAERAAQSALTRDS